MKKVLCLLGFALASQITNAQIKNADISVEITSPANNTVIASGDSLFLSFSYTNHGPDMLPAGDSLFFFSGGIVLYSQLLMDLPIGATIEMNDVIYYRNTTNEPIEGNFCILHIPQSTVIYQNGTNPITTYTDTNASNDTSCIVATLQPLPTGLEVVKTTKNNFEIFPNPATSKIKMNILKTGTNVDISITNSLGQVVRTEKINSFEKNIELNIDNLSNGVYFIRQTSGTESASARFTIQK